MSAHSPATRKAIFDRFEPLPQRAERNRRRLRIYMALYVTLSSALVAIALVGGVYLAVALVALRLGDPDLMRLLAAFTVRLPVYIGLTWAVCLPMFGVWCARAAKRPLSALLRRLSATPVAPGEHSHAKAALHQAVIASGMRMPRLALIPDQSVNAFVIAQDTDTAWIGVTGGLLDILSQDELRAVFAHLVSRVRDGSALTTTVLAELFDAASRAGGSGDALVDSYAPDAYDSVGAQFLKTLVSPMALLYLMVRMCLGISSAFILPGYRRAQEVTAEAADSEGMLLTRDPAGMLGALEKVLPADNRPGTVWDQRFREDVFGALFFAWPTFSFIDDRELIRIQRMREVLGAAGA